jgi:4-carboxymuconolactone decarboxylase
MTAAQREAAAEIAAGRRGRLDGPFVAAVRSPEMMTRLQRLGEYLRYDQALAPRLREMVILLTARDWTQDYEWHVHEPLAREAGLAPETIEAIADGRRPDALPFDEAVVWDVVQELQRTRTVCDTTYARAVGALGEQGVVDLIASVGYYSLLAMIMNVAGTALPEPARPTLASWPR